MVEDPLDTGQGGGEVSGQTPDVSQGSPSLRASPLPSVRSRDIQARPQLDRTRTSWTQMTPEAVESACLLAVHGIEPATIAAVLLQPEKRVARTLRTRACQRRIRQLRGEKVLVEAEHQHQMTKLLPKARTAIETGLTKAANVKNAADVGKWLHEVLVQKPAVRHDLTIQGTVTHDLTPIFEKIQDGLAKLREANAGRDPLRRVMSGEQAMARPLLEMRRDGET